MRPIDADALIEFCAERWIPLNIDAVNMQPTIEPSTNCSEFPNNSDTVSRQQAIDAVRASYDEILDFKSTGRTVADSVEDIISELPPAQPEPTDINAKEAVYNLAEKIGIHQLFALTVELRGEPIQPEPQEGHWIEVAGELECSECHTVFTDLYPDYADSVACPHCGARMTISK